MAKALEIEATDITYKKYYAEYCAIHNLGTPRHNPGNSCEQVDDTKQNNDQIEFVILNKEHSELDGNNQRKNGKYQKN